MASVTETGVPVPSGGYPEEMRTGYASAAAFSGKPDQYEQQTVSNTYSVPQQPLGMWEQQRLNPDALAGLQPLPRIFLRPIAAPSLLGMASFFAGTWCFSTYICGWYNVPYVEYTLFPFIFFLGGLAQFIAGFYGFPARDNIVTVFHVSWGAFYMSFGLLEFFGALNSITSGAVPVLPFSLNNQPGVATWFVVMAAITWTVSLVSLGRDFIVFVVTLLQAIGTTLFFAGWYSHHAPGCIKTGAYFSMVSALVSLLYVFLFLLVDTACDTALADNRNGAMGNRLLNWRTRMTNFRGRLPWQVYGAPVRIPVAEPGIRKGQ